MAVDLFIANGLHCRDALFAYVGKTADRLKFAARWMPGRLRKMMRRGVIGEPK